MRLAQEMGWRCSLAALRSISRRQERTGFRVHFREKVHRYFRDHLLHEGVVSQEVLDVPEDLLLNGNCIALAMWHLDDRKDRAPWPCAFKLGVTERGCVACLWYGT